MKTNIKWLLTAAFIAVALAGCGTPIPTPTPGPTKATKATFAPTFTPVPPTATPKPLPTSTPSPVYMYALEIKSGVWYVARNSANEEVKMLFEVKPESVEWQGYSNLPLVGMEANYVNGFSGACRIRMECPYGVHFSSYRSYSGVEVLVIWDGKSTPQIASFSPWVLDGAIAQAVPLPEVCKGGQVVDVAAYQEFTVIKCNAVDTTPVRVEVAFNGFNQLKLAQAQCGSSSCVFSTSMIAQNEWLSEIFGSSFSVRSEKKGQYTITLPAGFKLGQ